MSQWEPWVLYGTPALGLLVGALLSLGYFSASGVIQVLLDQRDILEEILQAHHHLLRPAEPRQPRDAAPADPFDLGDIRGTDEPLL